MGIFYGFDLVCLILSLLFAFYVNVRFLPELKIKGFLVWLFYLIVYVVLVGDIIVCSVAISDIDNEFDRYQNPEVHYTAESVARVFADTAMMGLGFQIVATMFSITLTLQLILQEIKVHEASTRRMYFYIFLSVCMLLQVLSLFFIFARDSNAREKRY